jgi:antitoxin component YwqK of YwqJK toxin-antitoxin module
MKIEATCLDGMHNGARTKTHSNGSKEVEHYVNDERIPFK